MFCAALSAPVTFTEIEKSGLRRAAQLAGLEVVGFIEEPLAAALAYASKYGPLGSISLAPGSEPFRSVSL